MSRKEYHYYFSQRAVANPLLSDVVAHVPGPLDFQRIREASRFFVGEHDFYNFSRRSSRTSTTVRRLLSFELLAPSCASLFSDECYFRIVGQGFLKQGIRLMVSALFQVGLGNLSPEQIRDALQQPSSEKLCAKAPAHGLHLVAIRGI